MLCLSLTLGGQNLQKKGPKEDLHVLDKWRKQFNMKKNKIRPDNVLAAMICCIDGGDLFIQNFMVVFYSLMVETLKSGAVNQDIAKIATGVDAVKEVDWCNFIRQSLLDAKTEHDLKTYNHFKRSLFLWVVSVYFILEIYQFYNF